VIRVAFSVCLFLLAAHVLAAAEAEYAEAYGYTLSMAGALINDNCERNWQASEYVSVYACNYKLAQFYSLELAAPHFNQCAQVSRGDIVKIADCMTDQFNVWISQHEQSSSAKTE
jgi:hypothetical protein